MVLLGGLEPFLCTSVIIVPSLWAGATYGAHSMLQEPLVPHITVILCAGWVQEKPISGALVPAGPWLASNTLG